MSGGTVCKCEESKKPLEDRDWEVLDYKCNHSAFNGGRRTSSDYSCVTCHQCPALWRTKADYVGTLWRRGPLKKAPGERKHPYRPEA